MTSTQPTTSIKPKGKEAHRAFFILEKNQVNPREADRVRVNREISFSVKMDVWQVKTIGGCEQSHGYQGQ